MTWTLFWQIFILIGWTGLWVGVLSGQRASQKTDAAFTRRLIDRQN